MHCPIDCTRRAIAIELSDRRGWLRSPRRTQRRGRRGGTLSKQWLRIRAAREASRLRNCIHARQQRSHGGLFTHRRGFDTVIALQHGPYIFQDKRMKSLFSSHASHSHSEVAITLVSQRAFAASTHFQSSRSSAQIHRSPKAARQGCQPHRGPQLPRARCSSLTKHAEPYSVIALPTAAPLLGADAPLSEQHRQPDGGPASATISFQDRNKSIVASTISHLSGGSVTALPSIFTMSIRPYPVPSVPDFGT